MSTHNYAYRLFDIMEEFGDDVYIPYKVFSDHESDVAWQYIHHRTLDGMGLLHTLTQEQGLTINIPQYQGTVPPWYKRIVLAHKKMRQKTPEPIKWKQWVPRDAMLEDARFKNAPHPHPKSILQLNKSQTADIVKQAKAHNVSMNAYPLWALNKVCKAHLVKAQPQVAWGNTINLRGQVPARTLVDNQSSIVTLLLNEGDTPEQVYETILQSYQEGAHWGCWDFLNTVCRLGPSLVRKRIKAYYSSNNSQMGTYSNLGKWTWNQGSATGPFIAALPPCTRSAPIAAVATTINDQIILSMGLHCFLEQTQDDIDTLLAHWAATMLDA